MQDIANITVETQFTYNASRVTFIIIVILQWTLHGQKQFECAYEISVRPSDLTAVGELVTSMWDAKAVVYDQMAAWVECADVWHGNNADLEDNAGAHNNKWCSLYLALVVGGRVRPVVLASSRSDCSSFTIPGCSWYKFLVSPGSFFKL